MGAARPAIVLRHRRDLRPYHVHFLRDIGAFQIGPGAVLLLGAFLADGLLVALAGVAVGVTTHLIAHVVDRGLGDTPATDITFLALIAVVLIAGVAVRAGARGIGRTDRVIHEARPVPHRLAATP